MDTSTRSGRARWLVILFAMAMAPVIYYFVAIELAGSLPETPAYPPLLTVFSTLAMVQLALGALVLARAPRAAAGGLAGLLGGAELATPQAFQAASVIGMALTEACAVLGFVLVFVGAPVVIYIPFGAASLAVLFAVGLPSGLGYWRERAQADADGRGPIE